MKELAAGITLANSASTRKTRADTYGAGRCPILLRKTNELTGPGGDEMNEDDWRLQGQARSLAGAKLHWEEWRCNDPEWDHDHCEFCWATFMDRAMPNTLQAGYTTADGYYWVCPKCFADFRERFGWQVESPVPPADPDNRAL